MITSQPASWNHFDSERVELGCQLFEIFAVGAEHAGAAGDDRGGLAERQFADIVRMGRVRHKRKCRYRSLRRSHRHHGRTIAAPDHFAPPHDRRLIFYGFCRDAEGEASATANLAFQRKHQRRALARAATEFDLHGEAPRMAVEVGEPHFREVEAGVPHQRSVGINPEVA